MLGVEPTLQGEKENGIVWGWPYEDIIVDITEDIILSNIYNMYYFP